MLMHFAQFSAILYSMVEISPMCRIIEFYTTDPHKGYLRLNFLFVHFHKDTKWVTTNKLASANWWFRWRLPMMLENTLLLFVISMEKLLHLPPCSKKVSAVLSGSVCTIRMEVQGSSGAMWLSKGLLLCPSSDTDCVPIWPISWPQLYRKCFRSHSLQSHTSAKLRRF